MALFFEDGSVLDLVEDTGAMSRKIEEYAPGTGSGDGCRRLLELSRKPHDISQRFFFWRSVEGLADTMDLKASLNAATMRRAHLRAGATVAGTIRRHVPDERVAQMLDHFVQYVGSSPFNPTCRAVRDRPHAGGWRRVAPRGGTKQIPASLQELARDRGRNPHWHWREPYCGGERPSSSCAERSRRADRANAVVSNMDAVRTYRDLIGGDIARRFERRRRYEPACSGIVFISGFHAATITCCTTHSCFRGTQRRSSRRSTVAASRRRTRPAILRPLPAASRRLPPGGEALYVLVHTPYPPAPRLAADAAGVPAGNL